MKKEILKARINELFKETVKEYGLTPVNTDTQVAYKIHNLVNNIRYANIFQAYGRPSETKIMSCHKCERLVESLRDEIDGTIINRGIAGAGKDNYNYLAKIKSEAQGIYVYVYCTVGDNKILIEPIL